MYRLLNQSNLRGGNGYRWITNTSAIDHAVPGFMGWGSWRLMLLPTNWVAGGCIGRGRLRATVACPMAGNVDCKNEIYVVKIIRLVQKIRG